MDSPEGSAPPVPPGEPGPRANRYAVGTLPSLPGMTGADGQSKVSPPRPPRRASAQGALALLQTESPQPEEKTADDQPAGGEEKKSLSANSFDDTDMQAVREGSGQALDASSFEERQKEMEKVGLVGSRMVAVWAGNLPERAATETAVRFLFASCGEVRRVYLRQKKPPARSWCLIMFRSSEAAQTALANPPVVKDPETGEDDRLIVEMPEIEKALTKANPGALAAVIHKALDDAIGEDGKASPVKYEDEDEQQDHGIPRTNPTGKTRRRASNAEIEIRGTWFGDDSAPGPENDSVLKKDAAAGRAAWKSLKTTKSRAKLSVLSAFSMNDDENEKAAKLAIAECLGELRQIEPQITHTLKALVELRRGELRGLDFKFKTATSLFRKLMSRLDSLVAASAHTGKAPPTPAEVLSSIMDILRYTAVFQTKDYTEAVRMVFDLLKGNGFEELRVKNFWGPGDGYQGINCVFISPDGKHPFELQFHTPESLTMKEEECHSSYEKFRTATNSHKMMQYWEEMVSQWDMVPVPPGVLEIPKVVQQTLEFDLSKLSHDERAAIKHRKSLEKVCRYPVRELHARAVKAEAECGSLMVWLMNKHGPDGICEGKEQRAAVRAELSILRQLVDTFIQEEEAVHGGHLPYEDAEAEAEAGHSGSTLRDSYTLTGTKGTLLDQYSKGEPADETSERRDSEESDLVTPTSTTGKPRTGLLKKGPDKKRRRPRRASMMDEGETSKLGVKVGVRIHNHKASSDSDDDDATDTASPTDNRNMPLAEVAKRKEKADANKQNGKKPYTGSKSQSFKLSQSVDNEIEASLPDEPKMRDKLRALEMEYPPLKYHIVVTNQIMYSMVVNGFLRDIAQDADYEIYTVNNWWDDLEKFGAVNARFLAVRHGIRFEVTLHTEASYEAKIAHGEYMRRKFNTVINTEADTAKVEETKQQMRREDMWRERWARIDVPDRALNIGTLRYAHIPAPPFEDLQEDALRAVGQSRAAITRLRTAGARIRMGVQLAQHRRRQRKETRSPLYPQDVGEDPDIVERLHLAADHGHSSLVHSRSYRDPVTGEQSPHARGAEMEFGGMEDGVGSAWAEMAAAFIGTSDSKLKNKFESFCQKYTKERGMDPQLWQPMAARVAFLEQQMREMRNGGTGGCFGRKSKGGSDNSSNGKRRSNRVVNAKKIDVGEP